ncbi:hypothetical protein RRG08_033212 [Elysia crispata]|uniref:Uncharacterized protein n=1 Tax=Elysia crispata TaxID=231223 RepID=A0AAE1BAA5_9GAST|nr:hypothetical protein RRG08_033212 [Elysia crispata]
MTKKRRQTTCTGPKVKIAEREGSAITWIKPRSLPSTSYFSQSVPVTGDRQEGRTRRGHDELPDIPSQAHQSRLDFYKHTFLSRRGAEREPVQRKLNKLVGRPARLAGRPLMGGERRH